MTPLEAIALAVKTIGGPSAVASKLVISPSAVSQWLAGVRDVPPAHCPDLERLTNALVPVDALAPETRWVRLPDPSWPHKGGRPCEDHAKPSVQKRLERV